MSATYRVEGPRWTPSGLPEWVCVVTYDDDPARTETTWHACPEWAHAEGRKRCEDNIRHVGHYSQLGGTYWCDTCDSPYCDLA